MALLDGSENDPGQITPKEELNPLLQRAFHNGPLLIHFVCGWGGMNL